MERSFTEINSELFSELRYNGIVIWLFNIGCEKYWRSSDFFIKNKSDETIVHSMEELCLLLADNEDYVILRRVPDSEYMDDINSLVGTSPKILSLSLDDDKKSISEIILYDHDMINKLIDLSHKYKNAYLIPFGVTYLEEKIAETCNLKIPFSCEKIAQRINNKIFIRKLFEDTEIPILDGYICYTIHEIQMAYESLVQKYNTIIIKQPNNASGKGLFLIEKPSKLSITLKMISKFPDYDSMGWIVEGWYKKKCDLNIQLNITSEGELQILSMKEQIVDKTVYKGSILPPKISKSHNDKYLNYTEKIGRILFSNGYYGIAGIDSIITEDNELRPLVEVNGRLTLSTFLYRIEKRYPDKMLFFYYQNIFIEVDNFYQSLKESLISHRILFNQDSNNGIQSITHRSLCEKNTKRLFIIIISDTYKGIDIYKNKLDQILNKYKEGRNNGIY